MRLAVFMGSALLLSACSNGGKLFLEPGARKVTLKGSPHVQLNQGGRALIIEQGKTASTGVHGWVAVQSVAGGQLNGPTATMILNKPGRVKDDDITQRGPASQ